MRNPGRYYEVFGEYEQAVIHRLWIVPRVHFATMRFSGKGAKGPENRHFHPTNYEVFGDLAALRALRISRPTEGIGGVTI